MSFFNVVQADLWLLLESASLLHKHTRLRLHNLPAHICLKILVQKSIIIADRECVVCLTRGEPHLFDLLHQRPNAP
jgi:hypothetical protein